MNLWIIVGIFQSDIILTYEVIDSLAQVFVLIDSRRTTIISVWIISDKTIGKPHDYKPHREALVFKACCTNFTAPKNLMWLLKRDTAKGSQYGVVTNTCFHWCNYVSMVGNYRNYCTGLSCRWDFVQKWPNISP